MFISKVYISLSELGQWFYEKLSEADKEKFEGCIFVPIKVGINESDMSLEALFVPTPSTDCNDEKCQEKGQRVKLDLYDDYPMFEKYNGIKH